MSDPVGTYIEPASGGFEKIEFFYKLQCYLLVLLELNMSPHTYYTLCFVIP